MKRLVLIIIAITFVSSSFVYSQEAGKPLVVIGDSLKGKVINGETVREVIGNVRITQEKIVITCKRAVQYLERNTIELIGDVVVTEDTLVVRTPHGFYFADEQKTYSDTSVFLTNGKMNLTAKRGLYLVDLKEAYFADSVKLVDSATALRADSLIYYEKFNKAVAIGNVEVEDTATVIYADSLVHWRNPKNTFAFGNVKLYDKQNNIYLQGVKLEDYGRKKYTKVLGRPVLMKIDTTKEGETDTLFIESEILEAYNDSTGKLSANDSVKIFRGDFSSVNNHTVYFRNKDKILIFKTESEEVQPVLWYEETQVTGDSIVIYLEENRIKLIDIFGNALIVSLNSGYDFRYNQISGDTLNLIFEDGNLTQTNVTGSVLSIYYLFEEDEPNGLLKSSSQKAKIFFENNKVTNVKLYGSPASEYHPESLIKGKEREFVLPSFIIYGNKPDKNKFLKRLDKKEVRWKQP